MTLHPMRPISFRDIQHKDMNYISFIYIYILIIISAFPPLLPPAIENNGPILILINILRINEDILNAYK